MNATTPPPHVPPALLGTWYLREAYAVDPQGQRLPDIYIYGDQPSGVIAYLDDGRMMALITHEGRALLQGDRQAAPAEERAEAYRSSMAYAGRYTLKGDWIEHHIDTSTYPNWVGTTLRRQLQWRQDAVVLRTAPQMQNGHLTIFELVWQRTPLAHQAP